MNKRKRISKCLDEFEHTHPDWWEGIAKALKIDFEWLQREGFVKRRKEDQHYCLTEAGRRYVKDNPFKVRPTLKELLYLRTGTVKHRGKRIAVFQDDPGQQYYFYYGGECIGCGTMNTDYEGFIKSYLDDRMNFICRIDVPDHPNVIARLEYRWNDRGKASKCLILTIRGTEVWDEAFYVGERFSSNKSCVSKALYIVSILESQKRLEEGSEKNQGGESDVQHN